VKNGSVIDKGFQRQRDYRTGCLRGRPGGNQGFGTWQST
jgi:hypothetical protein